MATIFKIWSKNSDDVYIGCTRTNLPQRLAEVKAKPPKAAINMMRQGDLCIDWIMNSFSTNKGDLKISTDRVIADYRTRTQYNVVNKQTKNTKIIKNTCECGGKYTNQNKAQHLSSKKHTNYLANAHTTTHSA